MKRRVISRILMMTCVIGGSLIFVSCKEAQNLNNKPWEEKVLFDNKEGAEKRVFKAKTDGLLLSIKDITYKNEILKFKTYMIKFKDNKLEKDMQVVDIGQGASYKVVFHKDYGEIGAYVKIGDNEYAVAPSPSEEKVLENGKIQFEGENGAVGNYDVVALDVQILEDGSTKVISEEKLIYNKEYEIYENTYDEFDYINNSVHIGMKEKGIKRTDVIKVEDGRNTYVGSEKVLGSDEYSKIVTYEWEGLLHNETKEILKLEDTKEVDGKNIFMQKDKFFVIDKKGNLVELANENGILKKKEVYENEVKIDDNNMSGKYVLIHKDDNNAYVMYKGEKLVNNEIRETKSLLYNFDLDSKKMNVIGGSDEKGKSLFSLECSGEGYVLFKKDIKGKEFSLGKLEGNRIKAIEKGIEYDEEGTNWAYVSDEYFIKISNDGKSEDKTIEVYKVK